MPQHLTYSLLCVRVCVCVRVCLGHPMMCVGQMTAGDVSTGVPFQEQCLDNFSEAALA